MKKPKILMQGAGSVGGLVGGRLLSRGHDVTFVTGNPNITKVLNEQGIVLRDDAGEVSTSATAYTSVSDMPAAETFDVICLAMMAQHAVASMQDSLPRLSPTGSVVIFQNGIVVDAVGEICGMERLVPSTLAFGMTMEAHGEYRLSTDGSILLGELDGSESTRVKQLAGMLGDVVKTKVSENILGVLWGKLLWNSSVSAICAMTGRRLGDVCGDPETQGLIIRAYREAVETAEGLGVRLEKVVVDFTQMYVPEDGEESIARGLLNDLREKYSAVIPSTSQSLQKGKMTEIDYLNGYVASKAQEIGKPATMHEMLTAIIKEIEQGHRKIDQRNLQDLLVV